MRVSINNVRTRAQLAAKLARQLDADSVQLMEALTDPALAREAGTDSLHLFSIFLPDTYEFYWTVTPADLVRRMGREWERFWTPERERLRARTGLSRAEVMTLASIVYEETRKADEMPRIAGVYMNRLRRGIPLQADPTVKYAMQDFGLRRILYKHLRVDSPYNTYINKGCRHRLLPCPASRPSTRCSASRRTTTSSSAPAPLSTAITTSHARLRSIMPMPGRMRGSSTGAISDNFRIFVRTC